MNKKLLCIITFLATQVVIAQDAVKNLTFEEAVTIAVDKNVDLNVQQNEVERSSFQSLQSMLVMAPNVRLSSDIYGRRGRQQIQNPETNQVEFRDVVSDNLGLSANASIPLFNGLSRIQTYRASRIALKSQEYALERSRQTTIFNVAQQYLQVLLSAELFNIAEDNHRNQLESLRRISGLVEVGALAMVDQFNQESEVKRLESLLIAAENTYVNDKLVLAQTLQLEPGTDFTLEKPNFSADQTIGINLDFATMYQVALENRPDLMQQSATVERNSIMVNALRGRYFPDISAFYNYGTSYNSTITQFSLSQQLQDVSPYHFYGFSVSIPIMNGFNIRNQVHSAIADRDNSVLQQTNLKTLVYRDVKTAYQNFEAAKAGYVSANAQLEAASRAYELEKERFELGSSAFFQFSQANNALVQGQAAKAQAEFTLMFQQTILDYQTGNLKTPERN